MVSIPSVQRSHTQTHKFREFLGFLSLLELVAGTHPQLRGVTNQQLTAQLPLRVRLCVLVLPQKPLFCPVSGDCVNVPSRLYPLGM